MTRLATWEIILDEMDEKSNGKLHKVLGAGIGWIMGGPVGAALGLLVGHTLHENAELLDKGTPGTGLKEQYDVLQVPYDAEPQQIRTAYKRLAQKYHPDRFVAADPVIRELAKEKMAEINGAYEKIAGRTKGDPTPQ